MIVDCHTHPWSSWPCQRSLEVMRTRCSCIRDRDLDLIPRANSCRLLGLQE